MKQRRKGYPIVRQSEGLFRHESYLAFLEEKNADIIGRPGFVPAHFFFSIVDGKIVGHIQIRSHINHPNLREYGGHIGYAIVPWEQGKGYGKKQLELGLLEAKKLGLQEVMITCLDENIASRKIIESQGGIIRKQFILDNPPPDREEDIGKLFNQYIISLL